MATILDIEKLGAINPETYFELTPESLGQDFLKTFSTGETAREQRLIQQTLLYAAETEKRIAAQTRRIEELETLSVEDTLTGLMNRRGFDRHLDHALARARRLGETGILIYCDLDNLKQTNDLHGHAAGDLLIRCAANTLERAIREIDIVARLGGDEFAILLTDTARRDAEKRIRTIQWRLDSAGVVVGGIDIPLRISMGSEPYGPHDIAEDLLHRADMAMYEAKRCRQAGPIKSAAE